MTTSDQFALGKCIGEGAFGSVYELIGHNPPAVIKYMLCGNAQRLKIFKNECEALKKIYHVNVVRLYRYTEEGKRVGIVMEYCQKGPLKAGQTKKNGKYHEITLETADSLAENSMHFNEDENQKELMKPIGFDDRTEWVMVESEERKYAKRFEEARWSIINGVMRDKLRTLNSAERKQFYKGAPYIVSRLKEETQTFKDARYVIEEILEIEEKKENLLEKDIYEIFELVVLGDFLQQLWQENPAFWRLKSHGEIWGSSFKNWRLCEHSINSLKKMRREKYTTNFYFRCFISQLTGEGWIHINWDRFVSEDLKLRKRIPGQWVDNPRTEIWSYKIENEDKTHEMLHFSHWKQIPLERLIEAFKKQQKRMEKIIKLHLKYLTPIEGSEKNNAPFNIESLLDESSEYKKSYEPHPFTHYIFQLRNPPRSICQKNHSGKCQMDGFRKMKGWSNLPKELHFPVCGKIKENEVWFLDSYLDCIRCDRELTFCFVFMRHAFLFLCCQNLLDIPFLILLDHPNNYENRESIPGFDFKKKLHYIDVGVLREYFQKSKLNERVYVLIKSGKWTPYIRLIDHQGKPETEWLKFNELEEERKRKKVSCSLS